MIQYTIRWTQSWPRWLVLWLAFWCRSNNRANKMIKTKENPVIFGLSGLLEPVWILIVPAHRKIQRTDQNQDNSVRQSKMFSGGASPIWPKVCRFIYQSDDVFNYSPAVFSWPFHSQEWSISNSPVASPEVLHMKNLGFHSLLRWKTIMLPIRTASLIHLWLGELCTFWTWEWKVQKRYWTFDRRTAYSKRKPFTSYRALKSWKTW